MNSHLTPTVCTQLLPPSPTVGLSLPQAAPPLQVQLDNEGEEGVKGSELVEVSAHDCLVGGRGSEEEKVVYVEGGEGEEGSKPVVVSDQKMVIRNGGWCSQGGDAKDVIVEGDDVVDAFERVELREKEGTMIGDKNSDDTNMDEEANVLDGTEDCVVDDEEDYLVDDGKGYGGDDNPVDTADHYMSECGEDYPVDSYQDYLADNGEGYAAVDGNSVEVSDEDYWDFVDGGGAQGCLVDRGVAVGCPINGGDPEYQDEEIKEEVPYEAFDGHAKLNDFEVFVGRLDRYTSEADLFQVFNQRGTLTQVRLIMIPGTKMNKGYAFLRFATMDQAKRVVLELRNPLINGRRCTVELASKQPKRARRFPHNPSYGGTLERDRREPSYDVNVKRSHKENYSSSYDTSYVRRPYPNEFFSERPSKYYKQVNGSRCTVRPCNEHVSKQPNRARRFPPNPSYGGTLERVCREPSCGVHVKRPYREKYSSFYDTSNDRRPYPDEFFSKGTPKYYKQDKYQYSYRPYAIGGTKLGRRRYHGSRSSGTRRPYSSSPGLENKGFANTIDDARCYSSLGNQLCRESNVGGSPHSSIHFGRDTSCGRGRRYWR